MFKKGFLSLLLVTLCLLALPAAADSFYLEAAGVTIAIPEGMIAQDASSEKGYGLMVMEEGREDIVYMYLLYPMENSAMFEGGVTREKEKELLDIFFSTISNKEINRVNINGREYFVVRDMSGIQIHYVYVTDGWMTDIALMSAKGEALEEADVLVCETLAASVAYDNEAGGAKP